MRLITVWLFTVMHTFINKKYVRQNTTCLLLSAEMHWSFKVSSRIEFMWAQCSRLNNVMSSFIWTMFRKLHSIILLHLKIHHPSVSFSVASTLCLFGARRTLGLYSRTWKVWWNDCRSNFTKYTMVSRSESFLKRIDYYLTMFSLTPPN